jgi:hypothetical protein
LARPLRVKDLDFLGFFTALDYNGRPTINAPPWRLGGFTPLEVVQVSIMKRATLLLASGIIDCASGNSENSFQQSFAEVHCIDVSPRFRQQFAAFK